MEIICTEALTKRFGSTTAVDEVSLHVREGEIYACLGLNGAGKTTLIRLLLGMIRPDSGRVNLMGAPLTKNFGLWNEVGFLVETPNAYPNLSVIENLHVYYTLRQLSRPSLIDDIIEKLKLTKYRDVKAKHLSLGNQQRLGLAKALMHNPKLLILDEPINGLDPEGIVEIRALLKALAANGATILLSSHILGEISKVAHRIGIIHEGKLIRELSVEELTTQLIKKVWVKTHNDAKAAELLNRENYHTTLHPENGIEITDDRAIAHPEHLSTLLVGAELPPQLLYIDTEDLEMFFLRAIKKSVS